MKSVSLRQMIMSHYSKIKGILQKHPRHWSATSLTTQLDMPTEPVIWIRLMVTPLPQDMVMLCILPITMCLTIWLEPRLPQCVVLRLKRATLFVNKKIYEVICQHWFFAFFFTSLDSSGGLFWPRCLNFGLDGSPKVYRAKSSARFHLIKLPHL